MEEEHFNAFENILKEATKLRNDNKLDLLTMKGIGNKILENG